MGRGCSCKVGGATGGMAARAKWAGLPGRGLFTIAGLILILTLFTLSTWLAMALEPRKRRQAERGQSGDVDGAPRRKNVSGSGE